MAGENSANVVHLESYIHVIFSNCILNKLGWSSKKCEKNNNNNDWRYPNEDTADIHNIHF